MFSSNRLHPPHLPQAICQTDELGGRAVGQEYPGTKHHRLYLQIPLWFCSRVIMLNKNLHF